jgi:hypothetical protein
MSENQGSILKGLGICWGLNLVQFGFSVTGLIVPPLLLLSFTLAGFGLIQLAYVVPTYISFKRRGQVMTARGLVIAASVTALLNTACDFAVFRR